MTNEDFTIFIITMIGVIKCNLIRIEETRYSFIKSYPMMLVLVAPSLNFIPFKVHILLI